MRYDLEFRHNEPPTVHPENEIVKWNGDYCYTVAIFRYNEREPCWYIESVGDRITELSKIDIEIFVQEMRKGFEYLKGINHAD